MSVLPRLKRAECETDSSPSVAIVVENVWSFISRALVSVHDMVRKYTNNVTSQFKTTTGQYRFLF
jgi:hypothetical protein